MQVSDNVKSEYQRSSVHKYLSVEIDGLAEPIKNSSIYQESMRLKEAIMDGDKVEFVGCISSMFKIRIYGLKEDVKGKAIKCTIHTENSENEPITLFNGIIDSAVMQSNKRSKEITAYDQLYTKGNTDVSAWYKGLAFPITLKDFRDSLFGFLGIEQVETTLPNDTVSIDKKYDPQSLKALSVIKAICQINGAFGIINRENKFEYRILKNLFHTFAYPGAMTFPSNTLFPYNPSVQTRTARSASETEIFSYYKDVNYEEYEVKPVDKLTIRQSESDAGVSYGAGTNNYIIQGNMFTYQKSASELQTIARNIYSNVSGIYFHPFSSNNNGLPYVECGLDAVSYYMRDFTEESLTRSSDLSTGIKNFYVFSRELSGIQSLRDNYSAEGEEYQTEFITDLQTQIDTIKQDVKKEVENTINDYDFTGKFGEYTYSSGQIDSMFEEFQTAINIVSVAELPTVIDPNTVYLIQGEVTVN